MKEWCYTAGKVLRGAAGRQAGGAQGEKVSQEECYWQNDKTK